MVCQFEAWFVNLAARLLYLLSIADQMPDEHANEFEEACFLIGIYFSVGYYVYNLH